MLNELEPALLPLLAARLRALGEPQRLRLMQALTAGERTVGQLVGECGLTQPNVSRHLAVLEQAGWVTRQRDGQRVLVRIADEVGHELCACVCRVARRQAAVVAAMEGEVVS
ncbi:MAG: winged helix-turn-helix transcriptional regulator [Fimbriimonadaceae bacterium]|nr:winged helix-turn-helix transcriptional regulator [Fimbriimonadaceae bacterium]